MKPICPLCGRSRNLLFSSGKREFNKCKNCHGIFVPPELLPDPEREMQRYRAHNNDVDDVNYQNFVSPIVNAVSNDFDPQKHTGLDYGAGTGPVITKMLRERNYRISPYDPFFRNDNSLLKEKYSFIVCCEVMEHFHHPAEEFKKLRSLLLPEGKLYCMTHLYSPEIDFNTWYYKNDPTHVFFYQKETLQYIVQEFAFAEVFTRKRLIVFSLPKAG